MTLEHKDHFHGSDLEKIEAKYHIKKEDIISFSANVNPIGVSPLLRDTLANHIDAITTYPDRNYTSLRRCIANYCNTDPENILVGNGTTELISLLIQTRLPKQALILGPTYSEYERSISIEGGKTYYYPLKEEEDFQLNVSEFIAYLNPSIDFVVICNPNNPTSTGITISDMRKILDACKLHDIFVMVDETYIEFEKHMEQYTSIPLTEYYNNIIILRGTSKFFAAPGLRLGYAITGNADLIKYINTHKNPWMINSLAAIAGEIIFSDDAYITETKELIFSERKRMYEALKANPNYKVYPPSANFILVRILKEGVTAEQLFEKAIYQNMMIRNCSTFPFLDEKYIRFCIMDPDSNTRLLNCLMDI